MAISSRMQRMHNCVGVAFNGEGFKGNIYNCYQNEPNYFNDVDDFFNIINAFLDALEFPAQKIKFRVFKKTLPTMKLVDVDPKEKLFETEKLLDLCKKDAYVIMMTGRDNASWQGIVYSQKEDQEYTFNSEIELLRIINK